MFHLLVSGSRWAKDRGSMIRDRVFEYTEDSIREQFQPNGKLAAELIPTLPALFMSETEGLRKQFARVGSIICTNISAKMLNIEYSFDDSIPPISNLALSKLSQELDIRPFEFSRTHWAIKNIDLFKVLLRNQAATRPSPKVFRLDNVSEVDATLLSVMMPFNSKFDDVYATLQATAQAFKMQCRRADNIWENEVVIQDIVSLISKSRIVICDYTDRNPNVFYEVGIAHALGRDVIPISQSADDIPFDVRHLRCITYLNNGEGRAVLSEKIKKRINTLLR